MQIAQRIMFTVYSMEGCDYCHKVQELLDLTGQEFVVYNLDQHFTIDEFEDEFGTRQFPQVVVDHVGNDKRVKIGGAAEVAQYFKENNIGAEPEPEPEPCETCAK